MYALKLRTNLEANISPTTMARMNLMGRLMQYQQPTGGTSLANVYNTPVIAAPIYDRNGVWAKNQMFTNPLAVQAANGYGQVFAAYIVCGFDDRAGFVDDYSGTFRTSEGDL